jgi:hypothetical protein
MRPRTLISHRLYFGIDAVKLRLAAAASRPHRLPRSEPASVRGTCGRISASIRPRAGAGRGVPRPRFVEITRRAKDDYFLTERFLEFAAARVVEPLLRSRAKLLLAEARS